MNQVSGSRLIYPPDLADRHCLSFTDQPYLRDLLQDIRGNQPITIVTGAGVSMESGLPSWSELVSRLISNIGDVDLEFFVKNASIDILRQAEVALALLERHDDADVNLLLRNGLYPEASIVEPGQLANAIARLVVKRTSEIRIITTNYDTLLERAIELYTEDKVVSYTLDEVDDWRTRNLERLPAVLHVHGLVGQEGRSGGPIVLTESQFLAVGAQVRSVISESLSDSMALLVGLSITDPNLVGPLYETKDRNGDNPRYSLNVVGPVTSETEDRSKAAKYHVESARYLEKLSMKPILLKSFSQLNQAVSDLALSIAEPQRYSRRPPKGESSLIYGKRFNRTLEALYSGLGCEKNPFVPTGDASAEITGRLRAALAAPELFLTEKSKEYGVIGKIDRTEHFQLCLWLRRLDRVSGAPSYSLELLGSSTFQNFEAWALRRDVEIKAASPYAAAQAVYRGLSVSTNLDRNLNGGLWKGVLAIPIRLGFDSTTLAGVPLDQLTVGALTIDSTHCVTDVHNDGQSVAESDLGIIGRLTKRDTDQLIDTLYDVVPAILFAD